MTDPTTPRQPIGRRLSAALAVAAIAALTAASAVTAEAAVAPPITVEDANPLDGQLQLEPAVQASAGTEAVWVLRNGGPAALGLHLEVHDLELDGTTVTVGAVTAGALLERDSVQLAPGEAARVPVELAGATAAGPRAVALVVTAPGADPPTRLEGRAIVRATPTTLTAAVEVRTAAAPHAEVALTTGVPTLASIRAQATGWPRRALGEVAVSDVVVLPPTTTVTFELGGLGGIGPVDVTVAAVPVLGDPGAAARASGRAWLWSRSALLATTALLVLATAAAAVRSMRRRRRRSAEAR